MLAWVRLVATGTTMVGHTVNLRCVFSIMLILVLAACSDSASQYLGPQYADASSGSSPKVIYIFAVHPLHNPRRLFEVYQPLVDMINKHTKDFTVKFEASRNYAVFEHKLYSRKFAFALPNPYQTVLSEQYGYRIFGKMADDDKFQGIIVVRKDSQIRSVRDLKGTAISFPAPTALAATMMTKYFLHTHGLDLKEVHLKYVGSQESSIMNVYLGRVTAACTWPPPWVLFTQRHPDLAKELTVKWRTARLINNGLVVRSDIPPAHLKVFENVIFNLQRSARGRAILEGMDLSHFVPADAGTFDVVRSFLKKYRQTFHDGL